MTNKTCLYLYEPDSKPYYNMALDNVLFEAIVGGEIEYTAILRLYSWKYPAITIGYNQRPERALIMEQLTGDLPVIRRITGGRAIYHDQSEITFSLIANWSQLPVDAASLAKTNGLVSEALVDIFRSLRVSAEWQRHSDRSYRENASFQRNACFDSVSKYEILSEGRKIVGGAQRRSGDCFIHQGSIKINGMVGHPAINSISAHEVVDNQGESPILLSDMKASFRACFESRFKIVFKESQYPAKLSQKLEKESTKLVQKSSQFK